MYRCLTSIVPVPQAREEGRRQAAEEWEDEKLHMEDHIHQLQDMLASLQGEFDTVSELQSPQYLC